MAEDKTTIVRLERSRTDRAFKEEESLWESEIGRIKKLIDDHMQVIDTYQKNNEYKNRKEMPRLSIGIYGSPGSGKSSFVETFVDMVNQQDDTALFNGFSGNFYSLPVIKPNILAKDEHFLYKFLATALNEGKKEKRRRDSQYRESSILSELEQTFQDVSQYLQVIDDVERRQDDDPLGVSLDRLDRHESGEKLVEEMGEFIDELIKSLVGSNSSSVVFMPVDDADLSMDTLISALSTCWRYLQHPRLIPIFTFTGRLAEELLRVHFEEKLTIKGVRTNNSKLEEASTSLLMTENMAIQYLGKLFPVRNRIRMGPASARVLGAEYMSAGHKCNGIDADKKGGNPDVLSLLTSVSKLLFGHSRVPLVKIIRPPLRMVTLRRQMQIVDAMQATGIEHLMCYLKNKKNCRNKEGLKYQSDKSWGRELKCQSDKSWGQLFDQGTWSLVNAHRDVLKELHMNLDDLYSWTPKGMRQVLLESVLNMSYKERNRLLKHWRYRTEDRRSQILSLLAANVFRPRMAGEEPTGDNPELTTKWSSGMGKDKRVKSEDYDSFSLSEGLYWFVGLCIGFYVPQILACNRNYETGKEDGKGSDASAVSSSDARAVSGIGWDFSSGPIHAVREALKNKKIFSTGMLFLDPVDFKKQNQIDEEDIAEVVKAKKVADAKKAEAEKKLNAGVSETKVAKAEVKAAEAELRVVKGIKKINSVLYTNIWCFYGFREGRPWAAVSLWRGLGLMARLLKLVKYEDQDNEKNKTPHNDDSQQKNNSPDQTERLKKERINHIEIILKSHLDSALVLGNLPEGLTVEPEPVVDGKKKKSKNKPGEEQKIIDRMDVIFPKWDAFDDDIYIRADTEEQYRLEIAVEMLAEDLNRWLDEFTFSGSSVNNGESKAKRIFPMLHSEEDNLWEKCFTRRLHGENLMSIFWQDLENAYYQKPLYQWNLKEILCQWFSILGDYWSGCQVNSETNGETKTDGIKELIMECPIFKIANDEANAKDKTKKKGSDENKPEHNASLKEIKVESIQKYSVFEGNPVKSLIVNLQRNNPQEQKNEQRLTT